MECKICNKIFTEGQFNSGQFTRHLKSNHNISKEEYIEAHLNISQNCDICKTQLVSKVMSKSHTGKHVSKETRDKLSKINKGRPSPLKGKNYQRNISII